MKTKRTPERRARRQLTLADRIAAGIATELDFNTLPPEQVREIKAALPYQLRGSVALHRGMIDVEKRQATYWSSVEATDRMGDVLRIKPNPKVGGEGVLMDHFVAGGAPVLWMHNGFGYTDQTGGMPVGKVVSWTTTKRKEVIDRDGKTTRVPALQETFQFHEEDVLPFAEVVWAMVRNGDLPACSVGFIGTFPYFPSSEEERELLGLGRWGVEYRTWEKLETSPVVIPANPFALQVQEGEKGARSIEAHTLRQLDVYVQKGLISQSLAAKAAVEMPLSEEDSLLRLRERIRSFVDFAVDARAAINPDAYADQDDPAGTLIDQLYPGGEMAEVELRMAEEQDLADDLAEPEDLDDPDDALEGLAENDDALGDEDLDEDLGEDGAEPEEGASEPTVDVSAEGDDEPADEPRAAHAAARPLPTAASAEGPDDGYRSIRLLTPDGRAVAISVHRSDLLAFRSLDQELAGQALLEGLRSASEQEEPTFAVQALEDGRVRMTLELAAPADPEAVVRLLEERRQEVHDHVVRTLQRRILSPEQRSEEGVVLRVSPDRLESWRTCFEQVSAAAEEFSRMLDLVEGSDYDDEEAEQLGAGHRSADAAASPSIADLHSALQSLASEIRRSGLGDRDRAVSRSGGPGSGAAADECEIASPNELAELAGLIRSV